VSENAEIVRRVYDHWARGDFSVGAEHYDEASVFILRPEFPDAGVYVGPEALSRYMKAFLEPWNRITIACTGLTEYGDTILAEVDQEGTGGRSGARTGFSYFQVWTFRGDTVVRMENIMEREDALAAAGR
jgi:ketosteroid isomerase-like protein